MFILSLRKMAKGLNQQQRLPLPILLLSQNGHYQGMKCQCINLMCRTHWITSLGCWAWKTQHQNGSIFSIVTLNIAKYWTPQSSLSPSCLSQKAWQVTIDLWLDWSCSSHIHVHQTRLEWFSRGHCRRISSKGGEHLFAYGVGYKSCR